jgi:hypothetical protein
MTKSADNLRSLLDSLDDIIDGESVNLSDIVESMGERSFATVLLIPALIMVSPISGIPGSPTVAAMLFGLISIQMLMGRAALWLPGFLGRLEIPADRFFHGTELAAPPGRLDRSGDPTKADIPHRPAGKLSRHPVLCLHRTDDAAAGTASLCSFVRLGHSCAVRHRPDGPGRRLCHSGVSLRIRPDRASSQTHLRSFRRTLSAADPGRRWP